MVDYYKNKLGEIPSFLYKYLEVPSLVRLKKVGYFCGMDYASKDVYNFSELITRYDHSLTVALITWKYTNSREATLAALFHDIATPCFSHVIDYMNKDYETQESTEEYTEIILRSDIILKKYLLEDKIDINDIIDFKKYNIVDNDRPRLCADRLDGLILTGIGWTKSVGKNEIDILLESLTLCTDEKGNNELGFNNKEAALLALNISDEIDSYCHSYEDNFMMELLANITSLAISEGVIRYEELYVMNEEQLFSLLIDNASLELLGLLHMFRGVKKDQINKIEINNIKKRKLNPLVLNKRIKKEIN